MVSKLETILQRPQAGIMGIINVTPDSFSDAGQCLNRDNALKKAVSLCEQGADIIDIGGESSRPGAELVNEQEELDRVIPVIEKLAKTISTPISVDTYKPSVMRHAVSAGAVMINDIYALQKPNALQTVSELGVHICLMHMQGEPKTMQQKTYYHDVVKEVDAFFQQKKQQCINKGIAENKLIFDLGIGFGKSAQHNLALLAALPAFSVQNTPWLIGVSNKSLIYDIIKRPVEQRLSASIGLAVQAVINGAKILRVHNVQQTYDAIRCIEAVIAHQ